MKLLQLVDEPLHVLKHAWSVRWNLAATAMGGLPLLLEGLDNYVPTIVFLKLMVFANLAAFASRFIKQGKQEKPDA